MCNSRNSSFYHDWHNESTFGAAETEEEIEEKKVFEFICLLERRNKVVRSCWSDVDMKTKL